MFLAYEETGFTCGVGWYIRVSPKSEKVFAAVGWSALGCICLGGLLISGYASIVIGVVWSVFEA